MSVLLHIYFISGGMCSRVLCSYFVVAVVAAAAAATITITITILTLSFICCRKARRANRWQ